MKMIKFLAPKDTNFFRFMNEVKSNVDNVRPTEALYYLITNFYGKNGIATLPSSNIGDLYDKYKDEDGFMYVSVCKENAMG